MKNVDFTRFSYKYLICGFNPEISTWTLLFQKVQMILYILPIYHFFIFCILNELCSSEDTCEIIRFGDKRFEICTSELTKSTVMGKKQHPFNWPKNWSIVFVFFSPKNNQCPMNACGVDIDGLYFLGTLFWYSDEGSFRKGDVAKQFIAIGGISPKTEHPDLVKMKKSFCFLLEVKRVS